VYGYETPGTTVIRGPRQVAGATGPDPSETRKNLS